MYIPLDHLYHWIISQADRPVNIYYFYPHGSKNLHDCIPYPCLAPDQAKILRNRFNVVCFDQEPLDFDYYQSIDHQQFLYASNFQPNTLDWDQRDKSLKNLDMMVDKFHNSLYDSTVLIHSEQNSLDVQKYQAAGYQTVHYWCHAVIARDWYRFAGVDLRLTEHDIPSTDFLIYSRDWSGLREYRLKFLEMIIHAELDKISKYYFKPISDTAGYHYHDHCFANDQFGIDQLELTQTLIESKVGSNASADYDINDHTTTKISVVLETQFNGSKIHLTEKICRALACGHPFILAAGPTSLDYIKHYGFETFSPWIDETYDRETDSLKRLEKIIQTMKAFAGLPEAEKNKCWLAMKSIAAKNQTRFFSEEFASQLSNELKSNLSAALENASRTRGRKFLRKRRIIKSVFPPPFRYNGLKEHLCLLRKSRSSL